MTMIYRDIARPRLSGRDAGESPAFEFLSSAQCRELLTAGSVGRLAVATADGPLVFPVNYFFDGSCIAVRTDPGTKLSACHLQRVAFEIDEIDHESQTGWSVVARGVATEITGALDHESMFLQNIPITPWASGEKKRWIRIDVDHISGRRIRRS